MVYSKKLFAERKDKAFLNDEQLTASQKHGVISQKEFMEKVGRRVTVVTKGGDILKHVGKGDFIISMRSFQGGLEYSYVEGKISSAYANFAKVPLPQVPIDEQKRIADYIEQETAKIDRAIPVLEKEIELLKEYRTRLISDVVTGQMDVRNVEVPEYTPEEDIAEEAPEEQEVEMDAD